MKNSSLFLVSALVWAWVWSAPARGEHHYPPPSEKRSESGKVVPATAVKAILVALTSDENVGTGCAANLAAMEMLVRGLPDFDPATDLVVLKGKDATAANFLKAVKQMPVRRSEALFVYFAGHGCHDDTYGWVGGDLPLEVPWDPSSGHVLQMPDGKLWRRDLLGELRVKGAKLTVLITDACNVSLTGLTWLDQEQDPKSRDLPAIEPATPQSKLRSSMVGESLESFAQRRMDAFNPATDALYTMPTSSDPIRLAFFKRNGFANFQHLLRMHDGIVDVNGTSRQECGCCSPDGGWFTIGLMKALEERPGKPFPGVAIQGSPGPCHWLPFLKLVSLRTNDIFHSRKGLIMDHAKPKDAKAREVLDELKKQPDQQSKIFQLKVVYGDK